MARTYRKYPIYDDSRYFKELFKDESGKWNYIDKGYSNRQKNGIRKKVWSKIKSGSLSVPSWFITSHSHRKIRRISNVLCRQLVVGVKDADDILFPKYSSLDWYWW